MSDIISILKEIGPSRSSKVAEELQKRNNLTALTARQRLSRVGGSVLKFPISLLPNREAFFYLDQQRNSEQFWVNFLNDLRETNSIYGLAIDGLLARGGIVTEAEFPVISGAPVALKKQVTSDRVITTLIAANVIKKEIYMGESCIVLTRTELASPDYKGFKSRKIIEEIIIDGLHDWFRKMGFGSFSKITIRKDNNQTRMVGPFKWDMTGPSYLISLKGKDSKPGFLIADVFSEFTLDDNHIKYFIRKTQLLKSTLKSNRLLAFLVADSFTGKAFTTGRSEGIVLATPELIFGSTIAKGIKTLLDTLRNAAAIASSNPEKLLKLITQLKDIEGAAGNLRGILFELISGYIAKIQGGSIEIGVTARDNTSGKTADIDVLRIVNRGECVVIECKGKNPGGIVSLEEVENWIRRIPVFISFLKNDQRYSDSNLTFEIWTSGIFSEDAIDFLQKEKLKRVKNKINWKDGNQVFDISKKAKEKTINKALREHFLSHPLSK